MTQQHAPHQNNRTIWALALCSPPLAFASAQAAASQRRHALSSRLARPPPLGVSASFVQGGFGVTEDRDDFKFFMAGVHAGKVLAHHPRPLRLPQQLRVRRRGLPLLAVLHPTFQRHICTNPPGTPSRLHSLLHRRRHLHRSLHHPRHLPLELRRYPPLLLLGTGRGGVLWTNHKYPAFGGPPYNEQNDGPNADASVWNFTPQGGVGVHYFLRPRRSIDFGANAIHISSASLGDRNPGVNASVQFSLGYTWWK